MSDGRKATLFHSNSPSHFIDPQNLLLILPYCLPSKNFNANILNLTVNDARAMRIAEIMTDFRNLQHYLSQLHATPTAEEYYLEGYSLLRQCTAEAQTVLQTPFAASSTGTGNPEFEKQQLKS
jgi:hypothetical protein